MTPTWPGSKQSPADYYATGSPVHLQRIAEWLIAENQWRAVCSVEALTEHLCNVGKWLIAEQKWHTDSCDAGWGQAIAAWGREEDRADELEAEVERLRRHRAELSEHAAVVMDMPRTYCDCRDWLADRRCDHVAASPQLPALDTPEALRYAAGVVKRNFARLRSNDTAVYSILYEGAARLEDQASERALKIEETAERGYEAWRSVYPFDDRPQWCDLDPEKTERWLSWAREMHKTDGAA